MAAATALLLLALFRAQSVQAVEEKDCYQFGSGGWDLIWWGDPGVRLPPGNAIPICNTGFGSVVFRWKQPEGVFLIPSEQCPGSFNGPYNDSYQELAPVSDSNTMGFVWVPPSDPGISYWITSQVPGECERGIKVRVDVIGSPGSAAAAAAQHNARLAVLAACLLGAFLWAV